MKELNPDIMALVEAERQFNERQAGPKVRRVKIEKVNQAWLVRFLPVALGKSNSFYVRIGQHWLNKKPIYCPRAVSPDFGGDENAECPVCDLSHHLNNEEDESLSSAGFKLRANSTHLTYCVVFQVDPGRGDVTEMSLAEQLIPWEFSLYKSTFDELIDYFRRGRTTGRPYSVLDPKKGNDFWATKTTKGIRLDRQDPTPIFRLDSNFDKNLATVMNAVQEPRIKLPTLKELQTFARKAEADAYGEDEPARGRGERGERGDRDHDRDARSPRAGRSLEENDDDGGDGEPAARPGRLAGRAVGRGLPRRDVEETPDEVPAEEPQGEAYSEPQGEAEAPQDEDNKPTDVVNEELAEAEDQVPDAEVPPRRQPPQVAPARQTRPVQQAPAPTRSSTAQPARTTASAQTSRPVAPTRVASASTAAPTTRPAAAATRAPAPAVRRAPPAPAPEVAETVNEEEDPGVAPEATDHAAPADEPLPQDQEQEPQAEEVERPRVIARTEATGGATNMRQRLASKIRDAQVSRQR